MKIALILFLVPIIIGCANIQQKKIETPLNFSKYNEDLKGTKIKNFILAGKISLFIKNKGFSGRIKWVSKDGHDNIEIYDPFNSLIAKISLVESQRKISFLSSSSSQSNETKDVMKSIFGNSDNVFTLKKFLVFPPAELSNDRKVSIDFRGWIIKFNGIHNNTVQKIPKTVEYNKGNISLKIFINDLNIMI